MNEESGMETQKSIQKGSGGKRVGKTALAVIIVLVIAAVGGGAVYVLTAPSGPSGPEFVRVDGSSTVFPITSAWAEDFNNENRQVEVAFSGTGGGFEKFCRGETDLSDASRPIQQDEIDLCTSNGITGIVEFLVAYDGLSVVVPVTNTFVDYLTVRETCRIWTSSTDADACDGAGPQVNRWNELRPDWPDEAIELFGPGTDSGTFDYFVEVIIDPFDHVIRDDFFPSEDDNVLVQAITAEPYSTGYFGYAYVVENLDKVRAIPIDDEDPTNGDGPIAPSVESIKGGTYVPLGRPLFVYANGESIQRQVVKDFLQFGFSAEGQALVAATGYVTLTDAEVQAQIAKIPA